MKTLTGLKIELVVNGESFLYGSDLPSDGYAGELMESDACLLRVTTNLGNVCGFSVDGKKSVAIRKNVASEMGLLSGISAYQQKITVKFGEATGVWHTEYPQNHIRLLEFKPGGRFTMWEISLVSQGGRFFVVSEATYEDIPCFRDESGALKCPEFDAKWPQLVGLLADILLGIALPPLCEYLPKPEQTPLTLVEKTARVMWWNSAQGVGMVTVPTSVSANGMARIHWSQLASRTANGRVYLKKNEEVNYEGTRTPHQKQRNTSFVCELVGVTLAE